MSRFLIGALLGASLIGTATAQTPVPACDSDKRCQAIRNLFSHYQSPLEKLAMIFLRAADENGLDWRLLPAISIVETSGGKHGTRSNVFGWNSGRTRFQSVEAGIRFVAQRFSRSPLYAGRTALGILQKYNPARSAYPPKVTKVMLELAANPVE